MKILCKVVPENDICCNCIDDQLNGVKEKLECYDCLDRSPDYEILQFGHSLFIGDWAMVLLDGKVERVKLDRVKRVRTDHDKYFTLRNNPISAVEIEARNRIITQECMDEMAKKFGW